MQHFTPATECLRGDLALAVSTAFFSESTRMTLPQNFINYKLSLIEDSCKKRQKSVRQIFLQNFGRGRVSTLKIIFEKFIMGRTVGFEVI